MSKRYGPGDKVFAKVRGYPPWPARVEGVADETPNRMKYHVFFYGTRETAVCKAEELFIYMDYREKYGKPMKKRGFNEGITQIESELGLTPKANLNTSGEAADSDVEDGNLVIDETPQGSNTQKKTKSANTTPVGVKQTPKGVKRKLEVDDKSSDDTPDAKRAHNVSKKSTPTVKEGNEVTSRSGRKIKPKKFVDSGTEENSNSGQETPIINVKISPVSKAGKKDSDVSEGKRSKEKLEEEIVPTVYAVTPGGQEVKIELSADKSALKDDQIKLHFQTEALKQARDIKDRIESGKLVPDTVKKDIEVKHHARQKLIEEVTKTCSEEDRETKLMYLRVEAQLLDIDINIKSSLNLAQADPDLCLRYLDELMELNITPLMLKKHPECVDTMKKLRKYVGNLKRWKMTDEESNIFGFKAALIRSKAEHVYNKFKSLFSVPENKTFRQAFADELVDFNQKTKLMTIEEVFGLFKDPMRSKNSQSIPEVENATEIQ